ncbi:hypothetical protein SASPL_132862 [Salvia splendens]|uniref:Vacuolar protein 8 n=1 Tax=Salvia splendens TaxID=180675 RepID=A0A8X8X3T7_SALSN|nr:hypothetical protein SASPL_132862 [Salvia splendens]
MERSVGKGAESSNSRDWDVLFRLFAKAIADENDTQLLGSPHRNSSANVQEASACCLTCITSQGEMAHLIGQSGAIPILLRLLPNYDGGFQMALLKCLRSVVTFWIPNRVSLASHVGLETVLAMLETSSGEFKLILLEILSSLALVRECSCIYSEGNATAKVVAGISLGVISSHVDFIRPIAQAGAIPLYAELLCGSDPAGKEVAEDVLCVLAVNEENAVEIVENLIRSLRGGDARAKAAAVGVIWDLSSYKEKAAGAVAQLSQNKADRAVLANSGAIQRLISMLEAEDDVLRDDAAEALVNFSLDPSLGEQISCILENPLFQDMQLRVMQMRDAYRHMEPSLQHPLTLNPALSRILH